MQVSNANNVKIYNLSAGKTLPEWISERRRRKLQQNDLDVRRRIELIQDFDMPGVSDVVKMSKDGQYILATGSYKPRVKCYDVKQLSMKFERCFDSEVVNFEIISDDYSKIVFLQCDRFIEFHAQYGKYYRTRIPKFGRDLSYDFPTCDLFVVGATSEIFRLNLEQGIFLAPYVTNASELNVCCINPDHHILTCGSIEGQIEAWDPRSSKRVSTLDCATDGGPTESLAAITALTFADGLTMAVGTSEGQVLLYDIRSNKPFLVKDHLYGLPVNSLRFVQGTNMVASMDSKIVRIWERNSGKTLASIEPGVPLNCLCLVPRSGMLFIANENKKILSYYIPTLGPAPSWCSFLDNLTEELEEEAAEIVYDDYKYITREELDQLGLSELIGSHFLRAYMHGYFIDVRLYRKAKSAFEPFNYAQYRKKRINEKIEEERPNRVKVNKLPQVNRNLAEKLTESTTGSTLMNDERFGEMWTDPDFQIDEESEQFKLINPVVKGMERRQAKKNIKLPPEFEEGDDEVEGKASSEDESSSDDDRGWTLEVKKQHKLLKYAERERRREEDEKARLEPSFYSLRPGEEYKVGPRKEKENVVKQSLGERLQETAASSTRKGHTALCHRELTFKISQSKKPDPKKHQRQVRAAPPQTKRHRH